MVFMLRHIRHTGGQKKLDYCQSDSFVLSTSMSFVIAISRNGLKTTNRNPYKKIFILWEFLYKYLNPRRILIGIFKSSLEISV